MLIVTSEGIKELAVSLADTAADMSPQVKEVLEEMGPKIAAMMRRALAPHRYTGELSDSITWDYKSSQRELHVGSDMVRRNYNALSLLESGTGPIPALPFTPIARWAEFRGIPAGPVWMSIKEGGVTAHPIRDPLIVSPEFTSLLSEGAKRLGNKILLKAFTYKVGVNVK